MYQSETCLMLLDLYYKQLGLPRYGVYLTLKQRTLSSKNQ